MHELENLTCKEKPSFLISIKWLLQGFTNMHGIYRNHWITPRDVVVKKSTLFFFLFMNTDVTNVKVLPMLYVLIKQGVTFPAVHISQNRRAFVEHTPLPRLFP